MKRTLKKSPFQSAKESIGELTRNSRLTGVTKGQFSLLDLIRAIAEQTGPAALTVSTWSTGIRDTENLGLLINKGLFTSVSLCLDRSFAGRQPQYLESVVKTWGWDNIRMTRNHAKFFLLRNDSWNICCRSSMNLNRNPRLEQYDIDDSLELCEFFQGIIDEIFEKMPPGLTKKCRECDAVFCDLLGSGLSDAYNPKDIKTFDFDFDIDFKF
ncbi:MAG TPA: hypothetical protein PLK94_05025 [Alphaproteobacteria bacterium]|nr:hypothetical protein [Alphaproteobacteria bacterium]